MRLLNFIPILSWSFPPRQNMQKSLKAVNAIKCALNTMKSRDIAAC